MIKRESVTAVRERVRIEEIIGAQVQLRNAGVGSMKGLCPFHDERTPSFNVNVTTGRYKCFGCEESGDAITYVMKTDGLSFTEAVEYLADRAGVTLEYEQTGGGAGAAPRRDDPGRRRRLTEANRVAAEFYAAQLFTLPEAAPGRDFLRERAFSPEDAKRFSVGYAPKGWSATIDHLAGKGFTHEEIVAAGLAKPGQRGIYDAFRGRLVWPICDAAGTVVGFGARRLYDDDKGPKFLNTTETALYKKSQVLYGIDLAKKAIRQQGRVVIVEGYADVMAAHLSGVECAVAACGTSFTSEHTKLLRRLMGDFGGEGRGEIVFVFDGDAAGQKAAEKAYGEDQSFNARTFVAVAEQGMDPCDLRLARGPEAVRALVEQREPLFEFVIRARLSRLDLGTVEGRVLALRETAGLVAAIRDKALRDGYTRSLSGWTGLPLEDVRRAVAGAGKAGAAAGSGVVGTGAAPGAVSGAVSGAEQAGADGTEVGVLAYSRPDPRDPVARTEQLALMCALQYPQHAKGLDALGADAFVTPAWRAVFDAVRAAGGVAAGAAQGPGPWVASVVEQAGPALASVVDSLAVERVPEDRADAIAKTVAGFVSAVEDMAITRQIADLRSSLARAEASGQADAAREVSRSLLALEARRRALRQP